MFLMMISWFVLGFFVGAITVLAAIAYYADRSMKKRSAAMKTMTNAAEDFLKKNESIADRLVKVKELQLKQEDLRAQIELPQKNSLDGKYKNTLSSEMKVLEEEKTAILQSILSEGFDPLVAIAGMDGSVETIKLSEFMARSGIEQVPATSTPTTNRNFTVYNGGKDEDDGDDGKGQTTH